METGKKNIKIWFTGAHTPESMKQHVFYGMLANRYDITLTEDCDFVFVDYKDYVYVKDYLKFDCVRIFYSSENLFPDYSLVDYAMCPNHLPLGDRHLWLPFYWFSTECWTLSNIPPRYGFEDWKDREKFCCFIVSNSAAEPSLQDPTRSMRELFFDELSKFKQVDSPGRFKQNVPPILVDEGGKQKFYEAKLDFMRKYRFAITFENSKSQGNTTEKIVHALLAGCIPIYWGDPLVNEQFDDGSFIWVKDEGDVGRAIELVKAIEADPNLAKKYFDHGTKHLPKFTDICRQDYVGDFLESIVSQGAQNAKRRSRYWLTVEYQKGIMDGVSPATEDELPIKELSIPLDVFLPHTPNLKLTQDGNELVADIQNTYKDYLQTFGGRFKNPPPLQHLGMATIPEHAATFHFGLKFSASVPVIITLHIMQYEASNQVKDDHRDSPPNMEGVISVNSKVARGAETFKLAIRLLRADMSDKPFTVRLSEIKTSVDVKKGATCSSGDSPRLSG